MKAHVTTLSCALACLLAFAGEARAAEEDPEADLKVAKDACRERAVEGSRYKIEDARVESVAQVDADRYHIEIRSPNGNYLCVVTAEGEIFSADEET